jgi:2-desacetyl-2-hydroxyethyl bacteriochlorophyllide A dehydrogenase
MPNVVCDAILPIKADLVYLMKALTFNKKLSVSDVQPPTPADNEALIRVSAAGICNTDIEITKGYIPGFSGILGHEFFGHVQSIFDSAYSHLIGKRVTAEINCACHQCSFCKSGLKRHCPHRTVIGISNRNGAFAEYITVPVDTIITIPDTISNDNALFIEPLAAALEILEQIDISPDHDVLILGDGKLAHLIAHVLKSTGCKMKLFGKHAWKVNRLKERNIDAAIDSAEKAGRTYDVVIEASGSPAGFHRGLSLVKPRGTFVLKSTYAQPFLFNPAPVVVDELTLLGSRCGPFPAAIEFLQRERIDLSYLISKRFPLNKGLAAFEAAQERDTLKVVIDCI